MRTGSRQHDAQLPQFERQMKRAFKALVKSLPGGQAEAAEILKTNQQRISDLGNPNHPATPDWRMVLPIEEEAPRTGEWPHVSRAQARHHGFELLDCGTLPDKADWHGALAAASKEFGEASAKLVAALADGTVSAGEIRAGDLIAELDQVLCPLVTLRGLAVARLAEEEER